MKDLNEKYRVKSLDEYEGNEIELKKVRTWLETDSIPHKPILISGPYGTGKTSLAEIIANYVDAYIINVKPKSGKEQGDKLCEDIKTQSLIMPTAFILNEVHTYTIDFWNTLLDEFENIPKNIYLFLTTTEPERKELKPVVERGVSLPIRLKAPTKPQVLHILKKVCRSENLRFSEKRLNKIIEVSNNLPRKCFEYIQSTYMLSDEEFYDSILDNTDESKLKNVRTAYYYAKNYEDFQAISKSIEVNEMEGIRRAFRTYACNYLDGVYSPGNIKNWKEKSMVLLDFTKEPWYDKGEKTASIYSIYFTLKDLKIL